MRQKTQTAEDALFRTALVNMRYGKCTPEDIRFLRTRIAGTQLDQPDVASKNFRNVPIICGIHLQKDQINLLGCERFASDTNQRLTSFYSINKWGKDKTSSKKSKERAKKKVVHESNDIDPDIQREIWKVRQNVSATSSRCLECNHKMKQFIFYNEIPYIVVLEYPMQKIKTSHSLELFTSNSDKVKLKLKGIVYHGRYHFTSRIVTADQQVWYYNGITTGQTCIQDGILANITEDRIKRCKNRDLVLAIYAQDLDISRKE